jgi:outer membrane protein
MQLKTRHIGLLFFIANLSVLAGIGYYAFRIRNENNAFIVNQRVFSEFVGKRELEKKLDGLKTNNNKLVDSLSRLIQRSKTSAEAQTYQSGIEDIKLMEQQLSDKYTADIWKQINQWVNEYGKQNGYDYVFGAVGNGSLMYAKEANDITNEVVLFINKKYQGD